VAGVVATGLAALLVVSVGDALRVTRSWYALRDRLHLGGSFADGRYVAKDRLGLWVDSLACRIGDARGCTNLGRDYAKGLAVAKVPAVAAGLFEQSCAAGDGLGCADLALAYAWGRGVAADIERANALYGQACDLGEETGCYGLGYSYEHGHGVAVDLGRARELYLDACVRGEARGCTDLGADYARGVDRGSTLTFYRLGCAGDDARACDALRSMGASL
jgi:TPR repeat protein